MKLKYYDTPLISPIKVDEKTAIELVKRQFKLETSIDLSELNYSFDTIKIISDIETPYYVIQPIIIFGI